MKINLYKNSVHFNSEIPIRAMEIFHYGQFSMDVNYNSIVRYNSEKIIIVFMDQTPLNEISIDYRGNLNIEQVIFYSDDSQVINYGRVVEEPQDIIEEMDIIKPVREFLEEDTKELNALTALKDCRGIK